MTKRTPLACLGVTVLPALTAGVAAYAPEGDGMELVGGARGPVEFARITAVPIALAAFCYAAPSAIGAGPRLLARGVVPR